MFDKKNLDTLRAEMTAVLQKYGVDTNLDITVGNMRFSDTEVEIKVTAKVKGVKTKARTILESRVAALGLQMKNKAGDILVDYNSRAYKMPFVYLKAEDGKRYKCGEIHAKMRFTA